MTVLTIRFHNPTEAQKDMLLSKECTAGAWGDVFAQLEKLKELHAELPASNAPPRFCTGCSDCGNAHSVIYALRGEVQKYQREIARMKDAVDKVPANPAKFTEFSK